MKKCKECLIEKIPEHFPLNKNGKDGYRNICKHCQAIKDKARYKSKSNYCRFCKAETGNRYDLCKDCKNNYSYDNCLCGKQKKKTSNNCSECYEKLMKNKSAYKRIKNGYVKIRINGHPRNTTGEIFEHILVMEKYLKRYLYPEENVHHINGVRDDNRIENLELWTKPQPSGIRVEDAIIWAKQILQKYEQT